MKRRLSLFVALGLIILALVGCSESADMPETTEPAPQEEAQAAEQEEKNISKDEDNVKDKELLENVSVTYEYDTAMENGKQRMIVWVENKTEKVFNGKVCIIFLDKNINELGADIASVENLGAGSKTWGNIYITPTQESDIIMTHDFYDGYSFTDDGMSDGTLNKELTTALSESIKSSFGNEYYTTSWYSSIKSIEVYSFNDKHWAKVIVTTQEKEQIDTIGNGIFGNAAYGSGIEGTDGEKISKIIVEDEAGNVLFTRSE